MNRLIGLKTATIAALALTGLGAVKAADAATHVYFSVGVPAPVYAEQPVYSPPPVAYGPPQVVYDQPQPVYVVPSYRYGYNWERRRAWREAEWRRHREWEARREWREHHRWHDGY